MLDLSSEQSILLLITLSLLVAAYLGPKWTEVILNPGVQFDLSSFWTEVILTRGRLRPQVISNQGPYRPEVRVGRARLTDEARVRHTHIVGATGSGKSVLLESLILQDMERGQGAVIIDPKGDRGFYERLKFEAERIGRGEDLYLLSATFKDESVNWNPCGFGTSSELQSKFYNANIYHEPFYAKACELGLLQVFNKLGAGIALEEFVARLKMVSESDKNNVVQGLYLDFASLIESEWKEILAPGEREIRLLDIVKEGKILYVDLPTESKRVQSQRVGRLLTQELMLISGYRKQFPTEFPDRPFSIFVDEFDVFATDSFSIFLNKARSSKFMIHIAHQTLSDLNRISQDFAGQILGNCNIRFIFRQDDPDDAETWARFIGTRNVIKRTYQTDGGSRTGVSSNRVAQEFYVGPSEIKKLKVGQCVLFSKSPEMRRVMKVPYRPGSKMDRGHFGPSLETCVQINHNETVKQEDSPTSDSKWDRLKQLEAGGKKYV